MVVPLSIFSSEKSLPGRKGILSALTALVMVCVVETTLHLLPPAALLGYGPGLAVYYEVRDTIDYRGAADVAILGSSRGREAIVLPQLTEMVDSQLGEPLSVANYSCPGGTSDEMFLITQKLLKSSPPPAVITYFISPRIFLGSDLNKERREIFGVFPNQYGESSKHYLASLSEKSTWNFRNFLGKHFYLFRYRYRIRNLITSVIRRRRTTSPVQGQYSIWQMYSPNRSLTNHPVSDRQLRAYVNRLLDSQGRFVMGKIRLRALTETIRICQDAEVPLVLVAAPISKELLRNYPPDLYPSFLDSMSSITNKTGSHFYTLDKLGLSLTSDDFREQSHVNLQGASKLTKIIGEKLIVPLLQENKDRETDNKSY